jgi:hypothetical protein
MSILEQGTTEARWISVVFLQGDEASDMLKVIDREGPIAAIYELRQFDFGDETVDAALVNGYVYDQIPAGHGDHTIEPFHFPYALTYNESFRYVSLLRRYEATPEPTSAPSASPSAPTGQAPQRADRAWQTSRPADSSPTRVGEAVTL